jgi:hypothetical protein
MNKHNVSLGWDNFRDRLKTATVILMYEKGGKENIHNYLGVLF